MKKTCLKLLLGTMIIVSTGLEALAEKQGYGPGRVDLKILAGRDHVEAGTGGIWNSRDKLHIQLDPSDGWRIHNIHLWVDVENPPITATGNPKIGHFNFKEEYPAPYVKEYDDGHIFRRTLVMNLNEDLGFNWGQPWEYMRTQCVAIHMDIVKLDTFGKVTDKSGAWVVPELIVFEDPVQASEAVSSEVIADANTGEIVADASTDENAKKKTSRMVANHEHQKAKKRWEVEELAVDIESFDGGRWGWWFRYEMAHPRRAHFIDSPVGGMHVETPTFGGKTDGSGAFDYFPGERAEFMIGSVPIGTALADHRISPLDIFESTDTDDSRVINLAVLLQSLDSDGAPKQGITITDEVGELFSSAVGRLGSELDFANDFQIDSLVAEVIENSKDAMGNTGLVAVSREEAKGNLEKSVNNSMFRKNVTRTPTLSTAKQKIDIMGVWFPALKANGEPADYIDETGQLQTGIAYYDEEGKLIRVAHEAKPIVVTYCDAIEETGAHDVYVAISRDDGSTWKRKNVSRMADRSSFTLANGEPCYGHCKKPVFHISGNKVLVCWSSRFARGGKPRYAIKVEDPATPELEDDYPYDDMYYEEDIWGISGHQGSIDYAEQGYPEVGEVAYSAVWIARGIILTANDLSKSPWNATDITGTPLYSTGDIVWFKPERLTSGRRDAYQLFCAKSDGIGFGLAWQEDPEGLRPGEAKGPGPGWGGATTNHKTDIWYSYITHEDFTKVDLNFISGGDSEHSHEDFIGRPKALVPMSLPVRISDNDMVNTKNMWLQDLDEDGIPDRDENGNIIPIAHEVTGSGDGEGSHRYGYMLDGLWDWNGMVYHEWDEIINWQPGNGGTLYQFYNQQGVLKTVLITNDGRALDGNTGASRPNLFLQGYTKPDGTKSAWAIMAYEESKGVGLGPSDETGTGEQPQDGSGYDPYDIPPDEGKVAIYHSFDFQNPDKVSAGMVLNLPETDDLGNPIYLCEPEYLGSSYDETTGTYIPIPNPDAGILICDWKGDPILAYENARRPRFILQSKAAAFGGTKPDGTFKEPGNSGTVLIVVYKEGQDGAGRPSDIMARRCVVKDPDGKILPGNPWDPKNFVPHNEYDTRPAVQNLSTKTPVHTWVNPNRDENAKGDGVKVCTWTQPDENRWLKSGSNPYEDARGHRGAMRGDYVMMGYSYTPNWAASRNAHDKYDFYIRRSFDGGQTWTHDPDATENMNHTDIFIDPDGISGAELNEVGDDVSEATKHFEVQTEYAPGAYEPARNLTLLKNNKVSIIEPRIVGTPGTIKVNGVWTGRPEDQQNPNVIYVAYGTSTNLPDVDKAPEDIFWSFTMDKGNSFIEDTWVVNPDSEGNNAGQEVTGWYRMAKGDQEQGEVQIRMTPDGSRFYGVWLDEGAEGSDTLFRRIMDPAFSANVALTETVLE